MKKKEKEESKSFFFTMPKSTYQQLVGMQFSIMKKGQKRVSMGALMRNALNEYIQNKKGE